MTRPDVRRAFRATADGTSRPEKRAGGAERGASVLDKPLRPKSRSEAGLTARSRKAGRSASKTKKHASRKRSS